MIRPGSLREVELCATLASGHGLDLDTAEARSTRHNLARILSNHLIQGVLAESSSRITASGVQNADDVRRHPGLLIGYDESLEKQTRELRSFLYTNLYFHPEVAEANQRACDMMASVFDAYLRDPGQIGREATRRVPNCGLYRAAGDYIAGMTDRYLLGDTPDLPPCARTASTRPAIPSGGSSVPLSLVAIGYRTPPKDDSSNLPPHRF